MTNVRKGDWRIERFNRDKIVRSMVAAGASAEVAKEVAALVPERNGISTDEIREIVQKGLAERDPQTAKRYGETRNMAAWQRMEEDDPMAGMGEESMAQLAIKEGDTLELSYNGVAHKVTVEMTGTNLRGIHLSEEDMKVLGADDGDRVAVRKAG
jgi:formylmethanofuran dehydrogenase subunit D